VLFGHPFREPFTAAAGRYWQDGRPTASVDFDPLSDLPAAAKAPDGIPRDYPLVNIQKAMENGHRNSDLTH